MHPTQLPRCRNTTPSRSCLCLSLSSSYLFLQSMHRRRDPYPPSTETMASRRQVYRGSDIPLADQLPVLRNLKSKKGNKASLTVSVHMYSAKPRRPRPVRANKRQFSLTSKLQIALTLTQTLSSRIDSSRPTFVQDAKYPWTRKRRRKDVCKHT